jgi:Flp pilus assembly protein TadD
LQQVNTLIQTGDLAAALARANALLVKTPRDAQLRFVRGTILADQNQTAAASAAFEELIEDFPELPEPYNNLAALLARQGQLERAQALLNTALKIRPQFALALENLGDIYLQMALNAYQDAATLEPTNRALQSKLKLARECTTQTQSTR